MQLTTDRLVLRPPVAEDVDAYLAFATQPEFAFYAFNADPTPAFLAAFLDFAGARPDNVLFVVTLDGRVIGDAGLEVDPGNGLAELGYAISPDYWGQGFATEAARAVLDFGFHKYGLARIWAKADPRNVASLRVLQKLGMNLEGMLRQHYIRRGERVNRACFGLLRGEWDGTVPLHDDDDCHHT